EKARVLNSNHCLGSEVLHKRDLLLGKWTNFLTINGDCTNQSEFPEHRHDEKSSSATAIYERDERRETGLVGCVLPEVRDMNTLLRCRNAREGNVRYIGPDNPRLASRVVCWLALPCDPTEGFSLTKKKIAKLRIANARGTG